MKVLLVNGGPHKKGATQRALEEIQNELKKNNIDSDIFWVENEPIAGCIACNSCRTNGRCFRNDRVNDFLSIMDDYDGYIFGSPVHYAAASGALSSFMDRIFFSSSSKLRLKPAACVVSCRRGGATAAFDEINKYFTMTSMIVVTSQYWNQVHGTNYEEVEKDEEGLQTMRTLANNMAYVLKCIEAAKSLNISLPEKEAPKKTNFIR